MKTFLGLTAADLMSTPVTSIPHDMLLRDAGHLLDEVQHHRCTGCRCRRKLRWASCPRRILWAGRKPAAKWKKKRKAVSFIAPWGEIISLDACEGCVVSRYMTKGPVTVDVDNVDWRNRSG